MKTIEKIARELRAKYSHLVPHGEEEEKQIGRAGDPGADDEMSIE